MGIFGKTVTLVTIEHEIHSGVFLCIKTHSDGHVLASNGSRTVIVQTKKGNAGRNKKAAVKLAVSENSKLKAAGKLNHLPQ